MKNINVTRMNSTTPKSPEENESFNEQANTKIIIGKIITEIILQDVYKRQQLQYSYLYLSLVLYIHQRNHKYQNLSLIQI